MTWLLMWHINTGTPIFSKADKNRLVYNYYLINKETKEELGPFNMEWSGPIKLLTEFGVLRPKKYVFYNHEIVTIKDYDEDVWDKDSLKKLEELHEQQDTF